ncbi:sodium:solute symporter family protein [bacterium]|nr:sodium:solute symporter family protein [bacterium]
MNLIDYLIFGTYFVTVLTIGAYFYFKNKTREDYFVGGRQISWEHIGFSLVATDVGGGFSIGLGGLGFLMGLSGSWLLFSGLVGAWMVAILIIPRIKKLDEKHRFLTYPDFLLHRYSAKVAITASVISGLGYLGFTGAQILAGAKLAAGTVFSDITLMNPIHMSLFLMAGVILLYTVLGGLKAVIYTDTVQWFILLSGLFLFGIPFTFFKLGGWSGAVSDLSFEYFSQGWSVLTAKLPASFFQLTHISPVKWINWFVTIVPVWFVAMTLYQRIYASRNTKNAQKAFFLAGLLEYPLMAFLGVFLGMAARIFFPETEAEMGLPMVLAKVLPVGIRGIVVAAYFSAIMSTADSCLIASSGNWVNDVLERYILRNQSDKSLMHWSQFITLIIGVIAVWIAASFNTVLEIILHAYAFMVSGLVVPTLGAYFWKKSDSTAAFLSMFSGGGLTLFLIFTNLSLPMNLDPSIFGIGFSVLIFFPVSWIRYERQVKHG